MTLKYLLKRILENAVKIFYFFKIFFSGPIKRSIFYFSNAAPAVLLKSKHFYYIQTDLSLNIVLVNTCLITDLKKQNQAYRCHNLLALFGEKEILKIRNALEFSRDNPDKVSIINLSKGFLSAPFSLIFECQSIADKKGKSIGFQCVGYPIPQNNGYSSAI